MTRIVLPIAITVLAVLAMVVLDLKAQSTPAPVPAPLIPYTPRLAYIDDLWLRRAGRLAALPYRVPGATLDPRTGGETPPQLELPPPAVRPGWADAPTDAHRIVVPAADVLERAARTVPLADRRWLRVDWRDHVRPVVLIGKAA